MLSIAAQPHDLQDRHLLAPVEARDYLSKRPRRLALPNADA